MSDINLTVEDVARAGVTPTRTGSLSTGNVYFVNNDGKTFLQFQKSGAGSCTVTVDAPRAGDVDITGTVPATTGDLFMGPFPPTRYNQPGTHKIKFTLSNITGLTVAVLRR